MLQKKKMSTKKLPQINSEKSSHDEILPILSLNPVNNSTNFSLFKRKLRTVVLTNFKTLEDCIECGELEDLEEFNLPEE
jgi:hypothetical protein